MSQLSMATNDAATYSNCNHSFPASNSCNLFPATSRRVHLVSSKWCMGGTAGLRLGCADTDVVRGQAGRQSKALWPASCCLFTGRR